VGGFGSRPWLVRKNSKLHKKGGEKRTKTNRGKAPKGVEKLLSEQKKKKGKFKMHGVEKNAQKGESFSGTGKGKKKGVGDKKRLC